MGAGFSELYMVMFEIAVSAFTSIGRAAAISMHTGRAVMFVCPEFVHRVQDVLGIPSTHYTWQTLILCSPDDS